MKWLVLLLISILCPSCFPGEPDWLNTPPPNPQAPQSIKELGFLGNTPGVHPGDFFYKDNETLIWNYVTKCRQECFEKSKYLNDEDNRVASWENDPEYTERLRKHDIYIRGCWNFCYDEISPKFAVATHIKDGLYSDGSFYKMGKSSFFDVDKYIPLYNTHPKKDQYQKTEWQKGRDECMEETRQIKRNRYEKLLAHHERSVAFYNDCLTERGY